MKLREKYWHEFFIIGIIIKSFTGLVETCSGLVLLSIKPQTLSLILLRLSGGGKITDADDFLLAYPYQYMQHLTPGIKVFAGLYILAHGLINLLLVMGLIKEKLWAYLVAIGVLSSFMLYQLYRIAYTQSPLLEALTVLDAFFVIVLWHEYKYQVKRLGKNPL
ncbi:MAG: DUF2127 domain-containing protein [Candidatus Doudnabacteria bacterium]|nr:DUF2127 domain-containing protein [Candidatus Doudnabacteria bacterium]